MPTKHDLSPSAFVLPKEQAHRQEQRQKWSRRASWNNLVWKWRKLGISAAGCKAAESLEMSPSEAFAHPDTISAHPKMKDYYRLIACLPKKGLARITSRSSAEDKVAFCQFVNRHVLSLLVKAVKASRENRLNPILVQAGKKQGDWNNAQMKEVPRFEPSGLDDMHDYCCLDLKAAEPLAENQEGIDLVLTPAIDGQLVREQAIRFNFSEILKDESKRFAFLEELFKFHLREDI